MTLDLTDATYEYYTETLGRSVIPDEATFTRFVLAPSLYVDSLYVDGLVAQKDEGGFVSAVCMMAEEAYKASLAESTGGQKLTGESLGDYSYTVAQDGLSTDGTSTGGKRGLDWLRLYCWLFVGVR